MSGIYIEGMEIPDNCTRCDYIGLNVAVGCPVMSGTNGRAVDCPLVAVPEHGRLIDADTMTQKAFEMRFGNRISEYGLFVLNRAIKEMPTIIPADKEGK